MILQGDFVKILGHKKYKGCFHAKVLGFNAAYNLFKVKLITRGELIELSGDKLKKIDESEIKKTQKTQTFTPTKKTSTLNGKPGYIINSDSDWFKYFIEEASKDGWIVHFQISGKQPAKIVQEGIVLFHRIKGKKKF
jgi:hypothetical protein